MIAVILGALLLREPVTIMTIVAMCIILAGVALMVTTTSTISRRSKNILTAKKKEN